MILAKISLRSFTAIARHNPKPLSLDQLLQQAERRLLDLALRRAGGNLTRAARDLGIWRQRLARRLEALEIAGTEIEIDEDEPAPPE